MRYSWILFDADGTLFDYERAESAALRELWSRADLPAADDLLETYRRVNGALWKGLESGDVSAAEIKTERFARLLAELGLEGDPLRLSADYLRHLGRQTQLLPGAEALLDSLAESRRLALITNGLAQVQRSRLRLAPIGRHFEALVISEEIGFAKPDPRIFDAALEAMGAPPRSEVLMVGDNPLADIGGARSYGLATCWLNLGGREPRDGVESTYEIHALDELEPLLAR